jgi:hypothetical protein
MQKYWNTVLDEKGRPREGASVAVQQSGSNSTIYSNQAGSTSKTNPLTTDSRGYFEFYAAAGEYDLVVSGDDFSTYTITDGALIGLPSDDIPFTPSGSGASSRTVQAKLRETVSITDFGASTSASAATNDSAISAALAAADNVYVPEGTFAISAVVSVGYGKRLFGAGRESSVLSASTAIAMVEMVSGYSTLEDIKLQGDSASRTPTVGLSLYGAAAPCIHNTVNRVTIQDVQTGVKLDGYNNTANPCYWNRLNDVYVLKPAVNGIHMTKSGAGDTPNANKFFQCHVYSNAASISGSGIWVEYGSFQNAFVDCESTLSTSTPVACVRVGKGAGGAATADGNIFINQYCETNGAIDNVVLEDDSDNTVLINLQALSAGSAINDSSGGSYKTFGAGYPITEFFGASVIQSVRTGKVLFDFEGAAPTPATSTYWEHRYDNAAPAADAFARGAICWNTNVGSSNGPTGWVCTVGGTPGTWVPFGDRYLDGSVTWDPASIADGDNATTTCTVTGAVAGDFVELSFTNSLSGLTLTGYVSAADTVTAVLANNTGGAVDLSSGTLYARVRKR